MTTKTSAAKAAAKTKAPKAPRAAKPKADVTNDGTIASQAKAAAKAAGTDTTERGTEIKADPKAIAAAQSALEKQQEQDRADQAGETETVAMTLVTVEITRDNTKTRIDVLEHEIEILEKVHGEENVNEVKATTVDVADFDPQTEFDTLLRKYGKNGERAVLEVYSSAAQLSDATGVKMRRNEVDEDGNVRKRKRNKSGEQALIVDFANEDAAAQSGATTPRRIIFRKGNKSSKR